MSLRRILFLSIVLLVAAAAGAAGWAWLVYERALPMNSARVEVRIASGASARTIARQLRGAGIDIDEAVFVAAARSVDATQSLRAGRYEVLRGSTLRQLLDKLRAGETLRERITVVEGWTVRDLRAALSAHPEVRQDSAKMTVTQLLQSIGATEKHAEGLFAPDTYVFDAGSSDLDILRLAYKAQSARLQQAWEARASGLPYTTAYDALVMASIIEKETGQSNERGRIAAVFVNRLRRSMLLQTDPTVIYGLGEKFDGNLRKRDLASDGPYNTYMRAGLPPTPIALPGRASIEAALRPESTRDLYFVARGDGTSQFSETIEEHNRAVGKYQLGARR